jgi:hypothetical protein
VRIAGPTFLPLILLLACASDGPTPPPALTRAWHDFLLLPAERAIAIAGDLRRGPWLTASSGGHATREEAVSEALLRCQVRREARRMQAACVLFGVGSEIVWRGH